MATSLFMFPASCLTITTGADADVYPEFKKDQFRHSIQFKSVALSAYVYIPTFQMPQSYGGGDDITMILYGFFETDVDTSAAAVFELSWDAYTLGPGAGDVEDTIHTITTGDRQSPTFDTAVQINVNPTDVATAAFVSGSASFTGNIDSAAVLDEVQIRIRRAGNVVPDTAGIFRLLCVELQQDT